MRGRYTQNECQIRNRSELLVRSRKHVLLHTILAILVKIGSFNIPNNNFEYVRLFVLPLNRAPRQLASETEDQFDNPKPFSCSCQLHLFQVHVQGQRISGHVMVLICVH